MELQKAIETRASVRSFKDLPVPEEDIRKIITAAGMAPSGKNMQCWHFVVVTDPILKEKLADVIESKNAAIATSVEAEEGARFRKFYKHATAFALKAPAFIIVLSCPYQATGTKELEEIGGQEALIQHMRDRANPGMQSLGAAMENLALKAVDLGYGTCWITSATYAAEEISDALRDELGFEKEGWYVASFMALGVPEYVTKPAKKKDVEDIYTLIKGM